MGRKNLVLDFKPIDAGDMSSASLDGTMSDVSQFDVVTYEVNWSGGQITTNGNLTIQYSKTGKAGTWKTLPLDGTPVLDGANGTHLIIINEIGFKFLKPVYTRTNGSASGSLTVGIFQTNKGA